MRFHFYLSILAAMIAICVSCSNTNNPVDNALITIPSPQMEFNNPSSPHHGMLGIWKFIINTDTLTYDVSPLRESSAIGDIFDADLSQFLLVSPCANCLWMNSFHVDDDQLLIEIGMKHPFGNITTRPDLHGFDIRAIFITQKAYYSEDPNITITKLDGSTEQARLGSYYFQNPDGYTSHYSELINDDKYFLKHEAVEGNLFPFLRFFEDYAIDPFDPHQPAGFNVMPVGSGPDYRIAVYDDKVLGDTELVLYVIADVAYGQSAVLANRQNPQYYLPAFNRTEPWKVEYWLENNDLDSNNPDSTADFMVQVFDWQHAMPEDPDYPDPANLYGVPESSKVAEVEVSFPTMMNASVKTSTRESGNGIPENPLKYRLQIKNKLGMGNVVQGLIAIRDELHGHSAPSGRVPIPNSPAGFPYATQDIRDYTLYQIVYANIPYANGVRQLYDKELSVDWSTTFTKSGNIRIKASFFMDPSMRKFKYDWDFDYDGVTFNLDGSGLPSPFTNFSEKGKHVVALRVKTNSFPERQFIYPIDVYREGVFLNDQFNSSGYRDSTTSSKRRHSVAMTSDKCYFVFTNKAAGRWDVYLGILEADGSSHFHRVTEADDENYLQPAITVVEEGPDAGVYVIFTSRPDGSMNYDIYSSYCNLDGSGFAPGNIKPVALSGQTWQSSPVIFYHGGVLYAYYQSLSLMILGTKIVSMKSTDRALTWGNSTIVDSTASDDGKYNPSITLSKNGYVYCVWEDNRYSSTNGIDLFCAKSAPGDFQTFGTSVDLSPTGGLIDDIYPEICSDEYGLIYIAYVRKDTITQDTKIHVQKRAYDFSEMSDYQIQGSPLKHLAPSIQVPIHGRVLLSFGTYDTPSNKIFYGVLELTYEPTLYDFYEKWHSYTQVGTVEPDGAQVYPCIVSRLRNNNYVTDSFTVYRNFTDGFEKVTSPFTEYFGEIYMTRVVTQGW